MGKYIPLSTIKNFASFAANAAINIAIANSTPDTAEDSMTVYDANTSSGRMSNKSWLTMSLDAKHPVGSKRYNDDSG